MYLDKCTNISKCTLPEFYDKVAKLRTKKLKSTLVDKNKSMIQCNPYNEYLTT